jgi:STE24 endopeptidase
MFGQYPPEVLLAALVAIVVFTFVVEQGLSLLNERSARQPLPAELSRIYDDAERKRSMAYGTARFRLGLGSAFVSTIVIVVALLNGWLGSIDMWVRGVVDNEVVVSLVFFAVVIFALRLISLPISIMRTFGIEKRFGFNRTTPGTFVTDQLKGLVLLVVLGGPLLAGILLAYELFGRAFWILAWGIIVTFSIFMFMFSTSVILPLFNRLTPVKDGELREAVVAYCTSQGYELGRLFVMDASRRSTKANAFFSGLGRRKTIVLFDTLVDKLTVDEVVAVLAHEIGHYRMRHTLVSFVLSNVQTLMLLGLLGWLLQYPEVSTALGAQQPSFHMAAFAFVILYSPLGMLLGLALNSLSRRHEYQADAFARETFGPEDLATALSKISTDSLANPTPHPLHVAFTYTHPPLAQRLSRLASV